MLHAQLYLFKHKPAGIRVFRVGGILQCIEGSINHLAVSVVECHFMWRLWWPRCYLMQAFHCVHSLQHMNVIPRSSYTMGLISSCRSSLSTYLHKFWLNFVNYYDITN